MFNPLICLSSNPLEEDDDYDYLQDSQSSSPKRSKKGNSKSNPYAGRGLDKFSALLAKIESQKRKIYTQVAPDEISIVRFVFSSDSNNDVVKPIVVKLKAANSNINRENRTASLTRSSGAGSPDEDRGNDRDAGGRTAAAAKEGGKEKLAKSVSWKKMKWEELRKPRFYMPFTLVMILVFLAIYGRAFAILCTSIGWYAIPAARGSSGSPGERLWRPTTTTLKTRNDNNKKYVRRFSEKNLLKRSGDDGSPSPKSGGLMAAAGQRHRRKNSL
ncbi:hypothetical protein DM860_013196 [Cuscuta australis]|uniref:ZCF37 n=1 Tax=Cuscuta australis TaxID=267555 RepID=A0A328DSV7_9ASTE|nr:hypothetical protein DM860_013196 [Cuscuta australis]